MSRTRVNTGFVAAGAINANTVLGDNVITANLIKTGAVGPTEIAAGAVSANTKIANGIITQNLIAAGNVVTSKINTGAVTAAKIAAGNVVTAAINDGAVTDAKIAAGTISASKMASGFVNANTDFAAGVITAHAIAAGNVGSSELRSSGLLTANTQFNSGIITQHAIASGNVVTSTINDAAVTGAKLAAGAVSANTKMAADVVGAREIRIGNLAAANAVFTHNSSTYAKAQLGRVESVTVGAANVTINFANCNIFNLTLGTNSNLNRPSNIAVGQAGTIFVTQDGTGSRTLSYSSVWDFAGGTAPTLTTTASAVDRIDYVVYSTSRIQAVASLAYS